MIEIVINGLRPASKKNHRRNFRGISLPSLAYVKFHEAVAEFLLPFRFNHFTTPLRIDVLYEIKGNYHQDLDNALSSIFDCLTDYQIIEDDDLIVEVKAKKTNGNKNWKIVIKLEEIRNN
jgi:Holliday junction resolvase RusA-like endonuclease